MNKIVESVENPEKSGKPTGDKTGKISTISVRLSTMYEQETKGHVAVKTEAAYIEKAITTGKTVVNI